MLKMLNIQYKTVLK